MYSFNVAYMYMAPSVDRLRHEREAAAVAEFETNQEALEREWEKQHLANLRAQRTQEGINPLPVSENMSTTNILFKADVRKKPHNRSTFGMMSWDARHIRLYNDRLEYGTMVNELFIPKTGSFPINGYLEYEIGKKKIQDGNEVGADITVKFFKTEDGEPVATETFRLESVDKRNSFADALSSAKILWIKLNNTSGRGGRKTRRRGKKRVRRKTAGKKYRKRNRKTRNRRKRNRKTRKH